MPPAYKLGAVGRVPEGYVAEVRRADWSEPAHVTRPSATEQAARSAARYWIKWASAVELSAVNVVYYILSVPVTWPGPPPMSHAYSGLQFKIGVTNNVRRRVANLKTGSSAELIVHALEPGGTDVERQRHEQFVSDRRYGEWFAASPRLVNHVMDIWGHYRILPPEHMNAVMRHLERTLILRGARHVLGGPPDMINPSLEEPWHGSVLIDSTRLGD